MARAIKIDKKLYFIFDKVYQVTLLHVQSFIIYVQELKFIKNIQQQKAKVICGFLTVRRSQTVTLWFCMMSHICSYWEMSHDPSVCLGYINTIQVL
jgi:hypothetical protein